MSGFGLWTSLDYVIEIARGYDGVTGEDVDRMLRAARATGAIERFRIEAERRLFLAPVVVKNCDDVPETLLFARELMRAACGSEYSEDEVAYASGVDSNRVRLIDGARPFVPGKLELRFVDFGANWDNSSGCLMHDAREVPVERHAGFEVIFAASQHIRWVRHINDASVPFSLAAALVLNVPGYGMWTNSPTIKFHWCAELGFDDRSDGLSNYAWPRIEDYSPE